MQDQKRPTSTQPTPMHPGTGHEHEDDDARHRRLREIAHRIWEADGRPEGRAEAHWLAAEAELAAEEAARDSIPPTGDGCGPEEGGPAPGIRARRALAKVNESMGKAGPEKTVARRKPARTRPASGAEAPGTADTPVRAPTPARTSRGRIRRPSEDA
ncbi:hypothetical protein GCM10011505_05770 [Tistrella bauzanensis]|uniref:DUF2934 domain-containing protein n=1 Tax=Tistrella bauzanensis TaxID=657419 RepID=A0ABQ1I8J4_9PROT|nr:DUF2934 domain-containing protein [Tistrella bauzanensis]GGB27375.1 hypothetical protein GCM10011505_05770 [Tistrella bauzanensis]